MSTITVARKDRVATVSLSRPEKRNAIAHAMLRRLADIARELSEDTSVRVVVFRGEGPDFSVGADLTDPEQAAIAQEDLGRRRRALQAGPRMVAAIQAMPQITIAALHGHCLGGAGCLALACDLRVVSTDLRFGMPEVRRGMNMSWRTVPLMVATFGVTRTKELLLTGSPVLGDQALTWGLANRVVDGSGPEATAEANRWAQELAESVPPLQATMIKETVNTVANALTGVVHMDTDQYLLAQQTEDFAEAISAFVDKRAPRFRGR